MPEKFSLVLMGGGGVGKSAITLSFTRNQFIEDYDPTIEDCYTKSYQVDGVDCDLDITDTAGQEEYRGLFGDKFMRQGDGFLCVYSITSRNSLLELEAIRDNIHRAKDCSTCPIVVMGNKCDLVDQRQVSESEGREFARKSNALFLETSAKDRINIEEAFQGVVREIRRQVERQGYKTNAAAQMQGQDDGGMISASAPRQERGCCVIL